MFCIMSSYHTEDVFPVAVWVGDNEGRWRFVKMSIYLGNLHVNQYDTQISSATVIIAAVDDGKLIAWSCTK